MTTPRHTAALLCSFALGALALPGCGGTETAAEAEQVMADGDRLLAEAKRAIAEQQAELTLVQTIGEQREEIARLRAQVQSLERDLNQERQAKDGSERTEVQRQLNEANRLLAESRAEVQKLRKPNLKLDRE